MWATSPSLRTCGLGGEKGRSKHVCRVRAGFLNLLEGLGQLKQVWGGVWFAAQRRGGVHRGCTTLQPNSGTWRYIGPHVSNLVKELLAVYHTEPLWKSQREPYCDTGTVRVSN